MDRRGDVFDIILPAGGRIGGEFAAAAGAEVKALIPLGGKTVLGRTLEALRATGRAGRLVVIGPDAVADHEDSREADTVLPEGATGPENIYRGLEWLRNGGGAPLRTERVLIVTTDLPFLTPEAVNGFIEASPEEADIALPLVRREAFQARFPGSENIYAPLRDGQWTMGCAFLVRADVLERSRVHIERVFAARKSQIAMARLLGPVFIARFAFRRLGVPDIERRCEQILGCRGAAVLGASPDLAFDIDLPADFHYARREAVSRPEPARPV